MTMSPDSSSPPRRGFSPAAWLSTLVGLLLRGVLALSALIWLLVALMLGTVLGLGLLLAGLLRGRRPNLGPLREAWRRSRRATPPSRPADDLVIDVQVREVPAQETRQRQEP